MKPSGIGGQAVIEGVMMKNQDDYAVAVRKPDHTIEIQKKHCKSLASRNKFTKLPIIRGVLVFIDSLRLGMSTLTFSASFFEEEETTESYVKEEKTEEDKKKEAKDNIVMGLTVAAAVVIAIGLFILLPFFASEALRKVIKSDQIRGLIEGVIRVALFVGYVKAISLMQDIKRVFMYHGAEHKTINCVENGLPLTVENVKKQNREHKRCGTSFLLVVMFFSILFFLFIAVDNMWLRMVARLVLIPVIAGVAYEFIRFAGRTDNAVMNALSKPGLWLQALTTAEPTEDMIEVAIASVDAVFDWKTFIDGFEEEVPAEETLEETSKEEPEETPAEATTESAADEDIQIVDLDSEDEEDDDILKALDRFFDDSDSNEETK